MCLQKGDWAAEKVISVPSKKVEGWMLPEISGESDTFWLSDWFLSCFWTGFWSVTAVSYFWLVSSLSSPVFYLWWSFCLFDWFLVWFVVWPVTCWTVQVWSQTSWSHWTTGFSTSVTGCTVTLDSMTSQTGGTPDWSARWAQIRYYPGKKIRVRQLTCLFAPGVSGRKYRQW